MTITGLLVTNSISPECQRLTPPRLYDDETEMISPNLTSDAPLLSSATWRGAQICFCCIFPFSYKYPEPAFRRFFDEDVIISIVLKTLLLSLSSFRAFSAVDRLVDLRQFAPMIVSSGGHVTTIVTRPNT